MAPRRVMTGPRASSHAQRVREPAPGGLPPAAVHEAQGPGLAVARLEALDLAHTQVQRLRGLLVGDAGVAQGFEDAGARAFLPTHGDGVHEGMTFSLNS